MQKYKITATKNQKKYNLILSAETQKEAQEKIHKEGYSILKIVEHVDNWGYKDWNEKRFIFVWEKWGEKKRWIIVWKDILKIYIKLIDELEYKILELYPKWDVSYEDEKERKKLMNDLEMWYILQKNKNNSVEKNKKKPEKKQEDLLNSTWVDDNFYLKKQLDATYKLIDTVIEKFNALFQEREEFMIDDTLYEKLQGVYTKIVTLKSSTNIPKLQEIWELSLIKIWEIELNKLKYKKSQELQDQLKETNKLLKKLGSKTQFKDPDTDLLFYLKNKILEIWNNLKLSSIKEILKKEEKKVVDTETYEYLKLVLQLEKYQKKLKEVNVIILKNFFTFYNPFYSTDEKTKIVLKKKVIEQNITILKAKKAWRLSSYTSVKKWYQKLIDNISKFLKFIEWLSISFVLIFSYLFLTWVMFSWYININTSALPYFLLFFLLVILTEIRRHVMILPLYIVFFIFSFIFIQVNF